MTRLLSASAFLLGAAAIGWMGYDFAGSNALAFAVTAVIGGVYLIGIVELLQFRRATATLRRALGAAPPQAADGGEWLGHWLNRLDPSLRNAVQLRIEGERVGLPAPVFTPYLVGLLVMLGLLGTFVGMVNTLDGAVLALQGSTELETIRAGLAAPIQGLGVAFGTSVAGVAASAMLGLISTLVRRDRMLATRQLDGEIGTVFRHFSLAHNRQRAFDALQSQARTLPAVADQLQAVATQLALMGDKLGNTLAANQEQFHESTRTQFTALTESVERSLRESLAASGQAAGDSIKPVVTDAMAEISRLVADTQQQLASTAHKQLQSFGDEFNRAGTSLLEAFAATSSSWAGETLALQGSIKQSMTDSTRELSDNARRTSATMLAEIGGLLQSTEALVQARRDSEAAWLDGQAGRLEQLTAAVTTELGRLRSQQEQGQAAAIGRLGELESAVADHLTRLGRGLEEPMARLIETASETPRAAAEVIGQLRAEISNTIERDNQLLVERQRVMEELNKLSGALQQASSGQREAVEKLVASSASTLQDISSRFGDHILSEVGKLSEAGTRVAAGATELSSLGEAFGLAVDLFNSSNEAMIEHLTRLEESMERSGSRSDEQMAYYVAQAREIIDQSMLSQKDILEDMRRLRRGEQKPAGALQLEDQPLEAEAS